MLLDKNNLFELSDYLRDHGLIDEDEHVLNAGKPGEGNMNYVLRVTLPGRTIIVKQARPYVEKYPTIAAPQERIIIEGAFYKIVQNDKTLSSLMPSLILLDEENHILVLEDLGQANDLTFLYQKGAQLQPDEAELLADYLSRLHNGYATTANDELMANRKLRVLNHEHIFVYPLLNDNGFDLDNIQPGLQELALKYKNNKSLKQKAAQLGTLYLQDGPVLLHGDYYPGSWLKTNTGVKVIDPEFCFYGPPEFDLGVMLAHLKMADQKSELVQTVAAVYQRPRGFNEQLLSQFIGIELIRRIIGLAQLPLTLTLQQKQNLLEEALQLLGVNSD